MPSKDVLKGIDRRCVIAGEQMMASGGLRPVSQGTRLLTVSVVHPHHEGRTQYFALTQACIESATNSTSTS